MSEGPYAHRTNLISVEWKPGDSCHCRRITDFQYVSTWFIFITLFVPLIWNRLCLNPCMRHLVVLCVHSPILFPSLRGFSGWINLRRVKKQKAHQNIPTISSFFPCFTSQRRVSDSGAPHLKHSSVPDSFSSNKRRGETSLFSAITQKSLPILEAPNRDLKASGHLKASFPLTVTCIKQTNKKERWLEVKLTLVRVTNHAPCLTHSTPPS